MKDKLKLLSIASTLFLLSPSQAQFQSLQTQFLRVVYYDPGVSYLVPHLARSFENLDGRRPWARFERL